MHWSKALDLQYLSATVSGFWIFINLQNNYQVPNVWCKLFRTKLLSIFVNIPMKNWDTETYNIFHFEVFGMLNLHYVIRVCQKIYNIDYRGRITVNIWHLVRNSLHQTLGGSFESDHLVPEVEMIPPISRE